MKDRINEMMIMWVGLLIGISVAIHRIDVVIKLLQSMQ